MDGEPDRRIFRVCHKVRHARRDQETVTWCQCVLAQVLQRQFSLALEHKHPLVPGLNIWFVRWGCMPVRYYPLDSHAGAAQQIFEFLMLRTLMLQLQEVARRRGHGGMIRCRSHPPEYDDELIGKKARV